MPPTPITFTVAILIGWPLLQLASVLFVRGRRAELRALAAELKTDHRFSADDLAMVERTLGESRGAIEFVAFPIFAPVVLISASMAEVFGRNPPSALRDAARVGERIERTSTARRRVEVVSGLRSGDEIIERDPRFVRLQDLAFEISVLRMPLSVVLTALTVIPTLPLYVIAYGLRQTWTTLPRAARSMHDALQLTGLAVRGNRVG